MIHDAAMEETVKFRVTQEQWEALGAEARRRGVPVAQVLREAVRAWLLQDNRGTPAQDFEEAIRLEPQYAQAFYRRERRKRLERR
jgi:hypothetical protein